MVRCQSPSVASRLNIWSRSLGESRGEQLASSSQLAGTVRDELGRRKCREGGTFGLWRK